MNYLAIFTKAFQFFRRFSLAVKIAVIASIGALVLGGIVLFKPKDQKINNINNAHPEKGSEVKLSPAPSQATVQPSGEMSSSNDEDEDSKAPDFPDILREGQERADTYWKSKYCQCDDLNSDRFFTKIPSPNGNSYVELKGFHKFTSFPYFLSPAEKYNHEWTIVSVVHAYASRRCDENKPCGDYQGGTLGATGLGDPGPSGALMKTGTAIFQTFVHKITFHVKKGHWELIEDRNLYLASAPDPQELKNQAIIRVP